MNQLLSKQLLIGVLIYLVVAGVSYVAFLKFLPENARPASQKLTAPLPTDSTGKVVFDQNLPKTQECPLNGAKYSTQQEAWWKQHRPLNVMIENHEDARPQSGLSSADVVYEAVAEGGITRFMAVFYCQDGGQVGPVRSARTYFMDFASEYGNSPLYVHVGGANADGPANALGQINDYGWAGKNDINQFSVGFPTFWRDYERLGHTVATEHTMYSTTEKLWKVATDRGLTNVDDKGVSWDKGFIPWKFKDEANTSSRGTKAPSYDFWKGYTAYAVKWIYDPASNTYKRTNGGAPHLDKDNNQQIAVKNVVVVFMKETNLNDEEHHNLYGTKGSGKTVFFMDGQAITGTWTKDSRTARTVFKDANGKQIAFNRGEIWISVLPAGNDVSY